jgi:hypothetical protein
LVIIYSFTPQEYREIVAIVGAAAAGVGALLAAFYAGRTLAHMVSQENAKLSFEKKKAALYFVERWDMIPTLRACKIIWVVGMGPDGAKTVADFLERGEQNEKDLLETQTHVGRLLNFMEEISLSAANNLVDEKTIRHAFNSVIRITAESTCIWRNNERGRRKAGSLWTEIDKLNSRWCD